MTYRVLITKTMEVPKNLYHEVVESEDEGKRIAQTKLIELEGDVAIVTRVSHGESKVLHRFEAVRRKI
ncbi:MAG TPA: hypothetical protein DCP63_01765 [Bacteroidetes bacterium]|nr:hypothetical protein [Bacteroidota bacterium]